MGSIIDNVWTKYGFFGAQRWCPVSSESLQFKIAGESLTLLHTESYQPNQIPQISPKNNLPWAKWRPKVNHNGIISQKMRIQILAYVPVHTFSSIANKLRSY